LNVTQGTNFTQLFLTGCNPKSEYRVQASAGSVAATFTKADGAATEWITVVQAFKEATAAAGILTQGGINGVVGGIH
jgi:hypothetical protein